MCTNKERDAKESEYIERETGGGESEESAEQRHRNRRGGESTVSRRGALLSLWSMPR